MSISVGNMKQFKYFILSTGGATRAALTQHHAMRGNLADVNSKDSSQETCVNLVASFVGLYLLTVIKTPGYEKEHNIML